MMQQLKQILGKVISTNSASSESSGNTKQPEKILNLNQYDVIGDKHVAGQVSLLGQESLDRFNLRNDYKINPGEFGENLTISGVDLRGVAILDQLKIGKAILEIIQLGKKCDGDGCEIFNAVGKCAMLQEGAVARVISSGKIKPGDTIEYLPHNFRVLIITLNDRVDDKVYEDAVGMEARVLVENFLVGKRWQICIDNVLLPHEPKKLTHALSVAIKAKTDVILTLGGTEVGPRDITPEVVKKFLQKEIPGIMENIRLKFGWHKPVALLSRSIAGIANATQIYTVPGSVTAVAEYIPEILQTLEHVFYMMHGIEH